MFHRTLSASWSLCDLDAHPSSSTSLGWTDSELEQQIQATVHCTGAALLRSLEPARCESLKGSPSWPLRGMLWQLAGSMWFCGSLTFVSESHFKATARAEPLQTNPATKNSMPICSKAQLPKLKVFGPEMYSRTGSSKTACTLRRAFRFRQVAAWGRDSMLRGDAPVL